MAPTLPSNGEVLKVKRNGPIAKAVNHLAGRVDRLEQGGVAPQSNGDPAIGRETAQRLADALERGHKTLVSIEERVDRLEEVGSDEVHREIVAIKSKLGEALVKLADLEAAKPREIVVRQPDGETVKIDGETHPVFEEVLELAAARDNIFLPGPSGSGKSHLARQVAEALGLKFGHISCSAGMSESQLLGRMVPHGENGQFEFLGTEFLDCYENGGVFLFDEIDAADSNVLLVINSALANGHLSVPSRHENPVAKRHPDFVCIAAANTWGRGADRQYVGRNELDESTIDRFRMGTVPMDYSEALERTLCPDGELYDRLRTYRQRIDENRLERIVSTRFIAQAYVKKHVCGWSDERIDGKLFQGWRADEVRKVKGN